jgi:hypothetical protein
VVVSPLYAPCLSGNTTIFGEQSAGVGRIGDLPPENRSRDNESPHGVDLPPSLVVGRDAEQAGIGTSGGRAVPQKAQVAGDLIVQALLIRVAAVEEEERVDEERQVSRDQWRARFLFSSEPITFTCLPFARSCDATVRAICFCFTRSGSTIRMSTRGRSFATLWQSALKGGSEAGIHHL